MAGYALPSRSLVSQQDAAVIQRPDVPRSRFTGAWTRKMTFDAGLVVPFLVDEVLPGDHLAYDVTAYLRMATPLFPLMDNQKVDSFFFFVPNRLVWVNWKRMMGEQVNPGDSIAYTTPQVVSDAGGFAVGSIYDHFGLPTVGQVTAGQTVSVSALPCRAYQLIIDQWFRDENLQASEAPAVGDGPDPVNYCRLWRRGKAHDYFTSCLPWPQKFTAPTVPLVGRAPVRGLGVQSGSTDGGPYTDIEEPDFTVKTYANAWRTSEEEFYMRTGTGAGEGVFADLAASTGVSINTLRQAWMVQSLLERDARGGTRYTELLRSHFGVVSPDARLQRPEYIGGGSSPVQLTPIAQTAPAASGVLGALGAAGTAVGQHRASYASTEHGYILGLLAVRTELSYQQGLSRMWTRATRFDYFWPALGGLGEQAVLRQEIYATGVDADDGMVFGFQERWHEYRTRVSEVTGLFRSTSAGTMDQWHLAQRFSGAPVLGDTFIKDTPPMDRVLAAGALSANQQYLADILIRRMAVRPIPVYGTPAQIGRF